MMATKERITDLINAIERQASYCNREDDRYSSSEDRYGGLLWQEDAQLLREAAQELRSMTDDEPQPIVSNQKASIDLKPGDYVFASRWSDCDPGDPWCVGFVTEVVDSGNAVYPMSVLVGEAGVRRWPHAMRITHEQGRRICAEFPAMEQLPQDFEAIARVFGIGTQSQPPARAAPLTVYAEYTEAYAQAIVAAGEQIWASMLVCGQPNVVMGAYEQESAA